MNSSGPGTYAQKLLSGKLLAKNTVINIAGKLLPLLVGVISIPYLIDSLGKERFGILTIVWVFIGYFTLFDLGFGRALTKYFSEYLGLGKTEKLPELSWNAIQMMATIGVIVGVVLFTLSNLIVIEFFEIPDGLLSDTIQSIKYTSLAVPFTITLIAFRSILMSFQRFDLATSIQTVGSSLNYIVPIYLLYFHDVGLPGVVAALMILKVLLCIAFFIGAAYQFPALLNYKKPNSDYVRMLFGYGGWITVSNFVGKLMDHLDKLLVASFLTVSAVAFYNTPLEVIQRLNVFPYALVTVLFPAMSVGFAKDPARSSELLVSGLKTVILVIFPAVLLISMFAEEGLRLWVDKEMATNSANVSVIFSFSIFFQSLAFIPLSFLHSINKPRMVSAIHISELIIYLLLLIYLIPKLGIIGAAISRLIRTFIDFSFLFYYTWKFSYKETNLLTKIIFPIAGLLLVLISLSFIEMLTLKITLFLVILALFLAFYWYRMIPPDIKVNIRNKILFVFKKVPIK